MAAGLRWGPLTLSAISTRVNSLKNDEADLLKTLAGCVAPAGLLPDSQ